MATAKSDCFTPLRLAPLTGIKDSRSQPDEMPVGAFREVLNFWVSDERRLCRRFGHQKLRSLEEDYNNSDLHDQLLSLQDDPSVGRQPISLLYASLTAFGASTLIAGTESRLYSYNASTANWKLFAEGLGAGIDDGSLPKRRFYAAQVGDKVYFTNDYDAPFCWSIGSDAVEEIADMEEIGLTRAAGIWAWHNIAFYFNVEMDGKRYRNRIVWSDLNDGGSVDPSKVDSITGLVDLEDDEEILGGTELGNIFLIFTTRRIYEVQVVAGIQTFNFAKRYVPDDNRSGSLEGCLFYRNTLVSDGTKIYYLGEEGVYNYDLYSVGPERVEWIHKATKEMFDEIDDTACDSHVGHYDSTTKEIWFSYVVADTVGQLPSKTLAINTKYPHTSRIDHGYTAFCRYEPKVRASLREWFADNNICSMEELQDAGYGFEKEGLPRTLPETTGNRITGVKSGVDRTIIGYYHADTYSNTSLTINTTGPKIAQVASIVDMAVDQVIKVTLSSGNYMDGTITVITPTVDQTGDTTDDDPVVANVTTTSLMIGMFVTGDGIPDNTHIIAVGATDITLNNPATATDTGVTLSFGGGLVTFDDITATGSGSGTQWDVTSANVLLVEDWEETTIVDSLCDKLGDSRLADLCEGCNALPITVMASATDWCLKERVEGYYRERCTNPSATGTTADEGYYASVGTYVLDGYDSILRPGPEHFGRPELEKQINYIEVNGTPEAQAIPSNAHMRIGMSAEVMDPNDEDATIIWVEEDPISMEPDSTTAAEHEAAGTRPDSKPLQWTVHMVGA